ncbi:unnamed protein product [Paramecium sonneborni]|uniref:HMG box domain-containing protein n=1 Tax=Paramecium sonneborni TaxID=65129 RepID=A0A8S1R8N5_9CILI|nr:unnamed protein product [Paramecium sonneborni]
MENIQNNPPIYRQEFFIFKEFLDGMKDICNKYQSLLPQIKSIRKRPKKYNKRPKDPHAPKMPQSAFIFYFKHVKDRFQQEHKGKQFQEITSMIAKKWNELSVAEQEPYVKLSEADRRRYNQEQKQYSVITQQQFSKYLQRKLKVEQFESDSYNEVDQQIKPKQEEEVDEDSFGGNLIQN